MLRWDYHRYGEALRVVIIETFIIDIETFIIDIETCFIEWRNTTIFIEKFNNFHVSEDTISGDYFISSKSLQDVHTSFPFCLGCFYVKVISSDQSFNLFLRHLLPRYHACCHGERDKICQGSLCLCYFSWGGYYINLFSLIAAGTLVHVMVRRVVRSLWNVRSWTSWVNLVQACPRALQVYLGAVHARVWVGMILRYS
jgi:hypothetical protein